MINFKQDYQQTLKKLFVILSHNILYSGCTYDISNKHRLGYSEVQLVQVMIDGVNTLYKEDLEWQKKHGM